MHEYTYICTCTVHIVYSEVGTLLLFLQWNMLMKKCLQLDVGISSEHLLWCVDAEDSEYCIPTMQFW